MTSGLGRVSDGEWMVVPSSSMMSALSARTRHAARRADTTLSGSYVALRTSALRMGPPTVSVSRLRPTPREVVHHIDARRAGLGIPTMGEHAELHVLPRRHGQERPPPPPPRRCR